MRRALATTGALAVLCLAAACGDSDSDGSGGLGGIGAPTSGSKITPPPVDTTKFTPTESNKDPAKAITGVLTVEYKFGIHIPEGQRVAYDHSPPLGGAHDQVWAACTGVVYPKAVRTENMVHSLEHGAVWIAYNPDQVRGDDLDLLTERVEGKPFTLLSPYPGLDKPISVQSWGHQLKVDSAVDERIDQFVLALKRNPYTTPEPQASCDVLGAPYFDVDNPPPFDPSAPGADAMPVNGK